MSGDIRRTLNLALGSLDRSIGVARDVLQRQPTSAADPTPVTAQLTSHRGSAEKAKQDLSQVIQQIDDLQKRWREHLDTWLERLNANPKATDRTEYEQEEASYQSRMENTYKNARTAADDLVNRLVQRSATCTDLLNSPSTVQPTVQQPSMSTSTTTTSQSAATIPTVTNVTPTSMVSNLMSPQTQPPIIPSRQNYDINVQFPAEQFPTFDGDITKFYEFWGQFEVYVDQNPKFNPPKKLKMLKGAMKSKEAAGAIRHFGISSSSSADDQYIQAKNKLFERFGNKSNIRRQLIRQIKGLQRPTDRTQQLRSFLDNVTGILAQLDELGEPTNTDSMLSDIEVCVPLSIRQNMLQKLPTRTSWDVPMFLESLESCIWSKEQLHNEHSTGRQSGAKKQENASVPSATSTTSSFLSVKEPTSRQQPTIGFGKKHLPSIEDRRFKAKTQQAKFNKPATPSRPCLFCNANHLDDTCKTYNTLQSRRRRMMEQGLCFNCGQKGHNFYGCDQKNRKCRHCKAEYRHYFAICPTRFPNSAKTKEKVNQFSQQQQPKASNTPNICLTNTETESSTFIGMLISNQEAVLSTAIVPFANPEEPDINIPMQALLDSGSQRSYITDEAAEELQLNAIAVEQTTVSTMGSSTYHIPNSKICWLSAILDTGRMISFKVQTIQSITAPKIQSSPLDQEDVKYLKQLAGPEGPSILSDNLTEDSTIFNPRVLLGNGVLPYIRVASESIRLPSGLSILPTLVGFVLAGSCETNRSNSQQLSTFTSLTSSITFEDDKLDFKELFHSLETIGIEQPRSQLQDDAIAEQHFRETVYFDKNEKRIMVSWPFRDPNAHIEDNKKNALKFLFLLAQRLQKDKQLHEKYSQRIAEQLKDGIIEEAPDQPTGPVFYMPHHPVLTPQKDTTKLRVVYNGSSKATSNVASLNEHLLKGPIRMPLIPSLLIAFRLFSIVIISDIQAAFLQIGLQEEAKDVTRFLWFRDPKNLSTSPENIMELRFRRVCFGLASSPSLLISSLEFHLDRQETKFATDLKSDIYMDNLVSGVDSCEKAIEYYNQTKRIMAEASMNLREFASNCSALRTHIQHTKPEDLAKSQLKVLGMEWNSIEDVLLIRGLPKKANTSEPLTRTSLLSFIAAIYDPLGLICPLTLDGKIKFQRTWTDVSTKSLSWNQQLPPDYQTWWKTTHSHLQGISNIKLQRRITPTFDIESMSIDIFVDASEAAYAAVAYGRFESTEQVRTNLMFAKGRLAPSKVPLTIPRMELMANLLGVRIASFLIKHVKFSPTPTEIRIWSDSQIALAWIQNQADAYKVWVSNRVKEIQETVSNSSVPITFGYICTTENPADLATRPNLVSPSDLQNERHWWWTGPSFLEMSKEQWPSSPTAYLTKEQQDADDQEMKNQTTTTHLVSTVQHWFPVDDIISSIRSSRPRILRSSSSTISRVSRIMMWTLVFIARSFGTMFNRMPNLVKECPLDAFLLSNKPSQRFAVSQRMLVLEHQRIHFHHLLRNPKDPIWREMGLKKDQHGLIRVFHRLSNDSAPVLIDRQSTLAEALVMDVHAEVGHMATATTLSTVRAHGYWISKGRLTVKRVLRECTSCKRQFGGAYKQPPFPLLPDTRVTRSQPFSIVGIDHFGPVTIKMGNDSTSCWTLLITCFASRAIHMEISFSTSAADFIQALTRFCARRGTPTHVYSDNASGFIQAKEWITENQRKTLEHTKDHDILTSYFQDKMVWTHIAPRASWQGVSTKDIYKQSNEL